MTSPGGCDEGPSAVCAGGTPGEHGKLAIDSQIATGAIAAADGAAMILMRAGGMIAFCWVAWVRPHTGDTKFGWLT